MGAAKAEEILSRAIYRRGQENGRKYASFAPADLAGLKNAFLGGIPDDGQMFRPEVLHADGEALDVQFHACPLREAWQEYGLKEEEVALLCRIAARIDYGTFERGRLRFFGRHLSARRRRLLLPAHSQESGDVDKGPRHKGTLERISGRWLRTARSGERG